MAISFGVNLNSLNTASNLRKTSSLLSSVFERLSSGSRINKASDDPAGLALAQQLNLESRLMGVALQNANNGLSYVNNATSGLTEINEILSRMSELSQQSANSLVSTAQRSALQSEFTALGSEIERIAASTGFNGFPGLSASSDLTMQVGISADESSRILIQSAVATLQTLGLGSNYALTYSLSGSTDEYAMSASRLAFSAIASAIDEVTRQRGVIDAAAGRLSSAINQLSVGRENLQTAEQRIRDTDIASDSAELTRLQVLQQAQIALVAQANQEPIMALRLLR